ncbi:diguanylate cyclase (GGDEF) domain-containing protein [Idiomarina sp. A28L]|uniref:diguanylate cyclase n=1 Tax=Idiomarina sp. A28L TaxID=1036674 RepID=UPI00021388E3|nr:diguanylate cyclase [Idiomarina sp. A28L]EGN76182.1 diguanylate cyclase (GGDEF) domain-containing protein [Idiomarina sp. A28L]
MSNKALDMNLDTEIAQIRAQYLLRLRSDESKLRRLVSDLASRIDKTVIEDIHRILHSIIGSAGTFGLHQASEEAQKADEIVISSFNALEQESKDFSNIHLRTSVIAFCNFLDEMFQNSDLKALSERHPEDLLAPIIDKSEETGSTTEVWLIEEDEELANQLSEHISNFNFHIRTLNLSDALAIANTSGWPPVTMIDLDGGELGRKNNMRLTLTAGDYRPRRLIALSNDDSFEKRAYAAKLRATAFVSKPINIPTLIHHIEKYLESAQASYERVLLVDDDHELRAFLEIMLKSEGIEVKVLTQINEIVDVMNDFRPELILLDMEMPDYSGIDIAVLIRQHPQFESIPIVYLSAEQDLGKQSEALSFDADDFLTKPISKPRLISSIRSRVQRARSLDKLISKDSLTGLLKHGSIKDSGARELQRGRRESYPVSIVMLDIDHFKKVNDTYGHSTGDVVISSLATLLRHRLRQTDLIGRYGGEEFLVILPQTTERSACEIINEVRLAFNEMQFRYQDVQFSCSLSAGCVESSLFADSDLSELIEAADEALYSSKNNGRNRVTARSDLD